MTDFTMIKVFAHWIPVLVAHGIGFTTRLSQLLWTSTDVCVKLSVGNYIMNFGCVANINKWEVSRNRSYYFASRRSPMKGYKHIDPDHCGLLRSARHKIADQAVRVFCNHSLRGTSPTVVRQKPNQLLYWTTLCSWTGWCQTGRKS